MSRFSHRLLVSVFGLWLAALLVQGAVSSATAQEELTAHKSTLVVSPETEFPISRMVRLGMDKSMVLEMPVRLGNVVDLDVRTSPLDPGAGYLEVWLINTDGKRMISIGVLDPSGTTVFPISTDLLTRGYVIVDISREGYDARPEHSGDSLARGTLPA